MNSTRSHHFRLRRRAGRQRSHLMPRACRNADPSRLSDHAGTGASIGSSAARRARRRSKSKPNSAAACRTIFDVQMQDEHFAVVREPIWKPCRTFSEALAAIAPAHLRRIERIARENRATPRPHRPLRPICAAYFLRRRRSRNGKPAPDLFLFAAEQMNVRAGTLPGDRGQRSPASPAPRGRDDRARFSRRQPLPGGYGEKLRAAGRP